MRLSRLVCVSMLYTAQSGIRERGRETKTRGGGGGGAGGGGGGTGRLYEQIIIIIDRFYIALFSALEQTHCARTRFYTSE